MTCTAKDLILDIKALKKKAIEKGIVREDKPLPDINEKDCPHKLSEGWLWVRLGDYALKVTDYVASGSFASLKDNVLISNEPNYAVMIKTADFSNNFTKNLTYTDKRGYEFLSNSNLYGGELILSNIGSIGKVFIVPNLNRPMTLASNTIMIKLTDEKLVKYLYYYFLSSLGQKTLKSISSGTSMLKFNKTQLKNILIPIAPLQIQNEIVNILDNLSNIIILRKQELQKLDDLIKARFVEMFGNKGENPNGYEEDKLGNLYKFQYGKGNNIPEDKGEYPCYGSNGIVGHHTEYNNEDSPIIGHIGAYAGIVNWGVGKHYVTYNGVMCKLKTDSVNPIYGFHLLQQQDFNRVATKGGGQPFVSYGDLEAPIVVVPPIEVQEAYAAFAEQTDKSKFKPVFL